MANEQNTEALTRKNMNFETGTNDGFYVCAQNIDQSLYEISECLKKAGGKPKEFSLNKVNSSHKGIGKPEYIITYNNDPNTILVIECKSNTNKHSSNSSHPSNYINPDLFYPKDYAVDGVLYYSYFLKDMFNVIAIAVSGNEKAYKVNEYYWVKGQSEPIEQEKTRNTFLTPQNYLDLIKNQKLVKNFSYIEIKEKAIEFNEHLRNTLKIEPSKRIMFIAGCLLALKDSNFQNCYSNGLNAKQIITLMFGAIQNVLKNHKIPSDKIKNIVDSCQFIKNNKAIDITNLQLQGSLLYFLKQLDLCIIPMINDGTNHQDSLGLFYHEFIKYTAGGTGNELGIVLTPPHLCDFMCELAEINKNDYVIDTCCGTGSFLISAMKHMFKNADVNKISEIKKNQLYGIEVAQDIFTIAVTNMIIRGDGQSHIYNDDCFNLSQSLNDIKFNVGLINPPYSQKDHCELEFVETMLDKLAVRGKGIVVVPMSCAIGKKFKDVRERLFNKHTLLAVFSMPDDIFYPVGTNVCVMVWEANIPHNDSNKETYFGYYKDDGFKKKKKLGRVDYQNKWESIKKEWVDNYINKKVIIGKTSLKSVKYSDEWLCEAYMETDCSLLTNNNFLQSVNDYCAYLVQNNMHPVLLPNFNQNTFKFDFSNWESFTIENLFNIELSKGDIKEDEVENGEIPLVSSGTLNNGIVKFINSDGDGIAKIFNGNKITVDMFCQAFYQSNNFYSVSHGRVNILSSKYKNFNKYIALFITTIINQEHYRFSYGRAVYSAVIRNMVIKLPAVKNQDGSVIPNWEYMENYIKSLPYGDQI